MEIEHVVRAALASTLAYLSPPVLEGDASAAGFSVVATMIRGSNYGIVLDDASGRIVAFRGTDEAGDWRTNLNVLTRSTPWGSVHRGFQDATAMFWPEVGDRVREASVAGRHVTVTGHSLGGAIAVLAAARLVQESVKVDQLCTFGQPPVGGLRFCARCEEAFGDRYIRCVNHTDAVADDVSMWRVHTGSLWYLDVDGRLHHELSFQQNLTDHVLAPHRFGGLSQIGAHSMAKYVPLLQALVVR